MVLLMNALIYDNIISMSVQPDLRHKFSTLILKLSIETRVKDIEASTLYWKNIKFCFEILMSQKFCTNQILRESDNENKNM